MSLFDDPMYEKVRVTKLSTNEAVYALREAWFSLFGNYPIDEALFILVAQSSLETGRWAQIKNFNFGNVKRIPNKAFTMFATGENIMNPKTKKLEYCWFEPPHPQTAFRAYSTAIDGAKDYISFLSDRKSSEQWRNDLYKKAFEFLKAGDSKGFSYTLHDAGYYTADPITYTAGVVRLCNEFLGKKDALLAWKPAETVTPMSERDTLPAPPDSAAPIAEEIPEVEVVVDISSLPDSRRSRVDNTIPPPNSPVKPDASGIFVFLFVTISAAIASVLSYCGHSCW